MEQHLQQDDWLGALRAAEVAGAIGALLPGIALVGTNGNRRVTLWSPEAERLFALPRDAIVGRPCPPGLMCDRETGAMHGFGMLVEAPRADGTVVRVRHYAHVFVQGGQRTGSVHVFVPEAGAGPSRPPPPSLPADAVEFHGLLTRDPAMIRVLDTVRNVAETDTTVLVRGESGTGKELVARAIHDESVRRDKPFVEVNCAAFTPTLLESELFGHRRGAFTGAVADREGIFAQADGGTLFLDEVAEIPLELQGKLLRVLQESTFVPVGGERTVRVDVRVVAATNRALREEVRMGRFREDLMYRLRVVPVFLPALRERRLDVELLLRRFMEEHNARGPRHVVRVAPEAMRVLLDHRWPGNVRELQNVVSYAFAVGRGPEIGIDELPPEFREPRSEPRPARSPSDEAVAIRHALDRARGDIAEAAAALGMSRTTFWRKRKAYGL